jgi:hypothetical protein
VFALLVNLSSGFNNILCQDINLSFKTLSLSLYLSLSSGEIRDSIQVMIGGILLHCFPSEKQKQSTSLSVGYGQV